MPLIRPHMRDLWDWDFGRPSRLFDQNFGLTLDDEQIFAPGPGTAPISSGYSLFPYVSGGYRPRRLHSKQESGCSQVACDKEKFEVKLDVQQFTPEEITVKTVKNVVIVEGKHDEKQDEHGYIQRHFIRKYVLPADVKPEKVVCNLSSDGVLSVSAARIVEEEEKETAKVVPIIQTGRPAVVQRQVSSGVGAGSASGNSTGETLINIKRETSESDVVGK